MARQTVSIYDIAELAGVSTATVSNVLNGKGRISQKTRERVLAIAHEQGYVPNFAAKSLREQSTHSVGIVTPDVSNDFYSSIVLGVETGLHKAGYDSYICNTSNDPERELDYVRGLTQKQVDGFVLVGGSATLDARDLDDEMPLVLIDRPASTVPAGPRHVTVGNDIHALVGGMVDALADMGCERIVFLLVSRAFDDAARLRYQGYVDALARRGLALDEELVVRAPHRDKSLVEAERAIGELLDAGVSFDGIACMGDRLALGASQALRAHGLTPGRQVLVMGMDDALYSRIASPTISSVRRHTDEMARAGVDAMLKLLAGEGAHDVIVPFEVVERETTRG